MSREVKPLCAELSVQFRERVERTNFIYNENIERGGDRDLLLKALIHDLNICHLGINYCKFISGEQLDSYVDTINMQRFDLVDFAESFNESSFKLIDTSDKGYEKDFNLRRNIHHLVYNCPDRDLTPTIY